MERGRGVTPYGYRGIRKELWLMHGFSTKTNDRAQNLFEKSLEHVERGALTEGKFERAQEFMHKHEDWEHLSPREREIFTTVLKGHLGIKEPLPKAANDNELRKAA